jgi:hypothetical protein
MWEMDAYLITRKMCEHCSDVQCPGGVSCWLGLSLLISVGLQKFNGLNYEIS